jgi:cephalosporin hydroxylase
MSDFADEVAARIASAPGNERLQNASRGFLLETIRAKYSYNFSWMGRPIIQYPQDIVAMQEIIWDVKPDLIIETGIAHGGSLIFSASMLALLELCESIETGKPLDPRAPKRKVIGVDIDIRPHNRTAIEAHPMFSRIQLIQGSSISKEIIESVRHLARNHEKILVCLDSNHTHDHVLAELLAYAPLTSIGSYCVAFDTVVDDLPSDIFHDRPWGPGNNPKTAVREFLKTHSEFKIDWDIQNKAMVTVAPEGFLRRVK